MSKKIIHLTFRVVLLLVGLPVFSQINTSGPDTVLLGTTAEFILTDDVLYAKPMWTVSDGSVIHAQYDPVTIAYSAIIEWYDVGVSTVTFRSLSNTIYTWTVYIVDTRPPAPNTTFTITPTCNATTIQRSSNPGGTIKWYWQTNEFDTSETLGFAQTLNLAPGAFQGNYYLRAKDESLPAGPSQWSLFAQLIGNIEVSVMPDPPVAPLHASRKGPGPIEIGTSTVNGVSLYHWYETATSTVFDPIQVSPTYEFTNLAATKHMWVASVNGVCESSRLQVTATILPDPVIVPVGTDVTIGGSPVTLNTQSFLTYSWKFEDGTEVGTTQSIQVNVPGTYTVTVTNGIGASTSAPFHVKTALEVQNINYVAHNTVIKPGIKNSAAVYGLNYQERAEEIEYLDGFGRTTQLVITQGSTTGKDLVTPFTYDKMHERSDDYLAMAVNQSTGQYTPNVLGQSGYSGSLHHQFYNQTQTLNANVPRDAQPYATTLFDKTQLRRPMQVGSLGVSWQPALTSVRTSYDANGASEVKRWILNASGMPEILSSQIYWQAGLLDKTVMEEYQSAVKKEEGYAFNSYEGLLLCQKARKGSEWLETYYVYDTYGNLRFVLPPALIKELGSALVPTPSQLDRWASEIRYDNLRRKIAIKIPGAGWEYTVYDKRNRAVLKQRSRQAAAREWSFIKYDELDRPVIAGVYRVPANESSTREALQLIVDGLQYGQGYEHTSVPHHGTDGIITGTDVILASAPGSPELQATSSITLKPGFVYVPTGTNEFSASIGDGRTPRSSCFPSVNEDNYSVTYYDNYTASPELFQNPVLAYTPETWETSAAVVALRNSAIRGMTTAMSTRILGTDQWLHTIIYYDEQRRIIQTVSSNHLGTIDRSSTLFSSTGNVVETVDWNNGEKVTLITEYDSRNRPYRSFHRLNQQPKILLSQADYNELGQMTRKRIHSTDGGTTFLQSIDYQYNIKGWITGINTNGAPEVDYFTQAFDYHVANYGGTLRWDGLPNAMMWKNDISANKNVYLFSYDQGNKYLNTAAYKRVSATGLEVDQNKFSENGMTYDANGNIQTLVRYQGVTSKIDDLDYEYGSEPGNQLKRVSDLAPAATRDQGFKDGLNSDDDYTYDASGNVISDKNRGITSIEYNYWNLPSKFVFDDGNRLEISFDAGGLKLSERLISAQDEDIFIVDYVGPNVYLNGDLYYLFHEEGRLVAPTFHNLLANRDATSTEGFTAAQEVTLSCVSSGGQNYVKAICNQSGGSPGISPIGGTIAVKPGEKYAFKVLGYSTSGNAALNVWSNGAGGAIVAAGAALPAGVSNETWVTAEFTIPADVTEIKVGVLYTAAAPSQEFYINRVALYKLDLEYQYDLLDNQQNTRIVLNATPATLSYTATVEPANATQETEQFFNINYNQVVNHPAANATPGGSHAVKVNLANRIGPAKSMVVYPGDAVNANVNAFYGVGSFNHAAMGSIISAVSAVISGGSQVVIDGITTAYNTSTPDVFQLSPAVGSSKPSAYLNYMLFDENFTILEAKSASLGSAGVRHIVSLPQINIKQKGILFIYISYDDQAAADVYFDDLKITHLESPVIQSSEYYPFGMVSRTWVREGEIENPYGYQNKRYDSLTQTYDFGARRYDATLGRWFAPDEKNQFANPYLAMGNLPMVSVDPDGNIVFIPILVGAIVGGTVGYIGGKRAGLTGIDLAAYALGSAMMGAMSSGVGSTIQTSIGTATFGSFMLSYTVSGAVTTAITNGFMTVFNGKDFMEEAGKGFIRGGITGVISGAVFGGADYAKRVSAARKAILASGRFTADQAIKMTDQELLDFIEAHPELKTMYQNAGEPGLHAGTPPPNYETDPASKNFVRKGAAMPGMTKEQVAGVTSVRLPNGVKSVDHAMSLGITSYKTDIAIAPARFTRAIKLYMTLGHELTHATHWFNGSIARWYAMGRGNFEYVRAMTEIDAHSWSIKTGRSMYYGTSVNYTKVQEYTKYLSDKGCFHWSVMYRHKW